ncbi:hypothetical protein ONE63_006490 [Megalurothrips usitatus]|uniref:Uncharacterized protein n=1 Tax=Megalurothrips usitatus TaxID=439358 RepID=A0AAV7XW33_9NEOP|nr:hypothetical protein ONE63_006490 [Megalurothrips usitatus]
MRMEYNTCFPDTQSILADQQKCVPYVYGAVVINSQGMGDLKAVEYSGPTYVAIRSGSSISSPADAQAADFDRLSNLENFHTMAKNEHGAMKPVVIMAVNGGPDENDEGRTINKELEAENFACAGRILSEVWNSTVIDGHAVVAEPISGVQWSVQVEENADWYSRHVRESQYLLQVLARRGKELLCLFRDDNSGAEDAEWHDEDAVDTDIKMSMETETPQHMPIVSSTMDWLSSPWTNFM